MLIKIGENGVVFEVRSCLDERTVRAVTFCLDYAIGLGEKTILLDFSRVENFEYLGVTMLIERLLHYKKSKEIEIGLQGLDRKCLEVVSLLA